MCYFAVPSFWGPCGAHWGTCCPSRLQTGALRQGLPRGRGSQGKALNHPICSSSGHTPASAKPKESNKEISSRNDFYYFFLFVLHCAPTTVWRVISPSIPPRSPTMGKGRGDGGGEGKGREGGKGKREGKEGEAAAAAWVTAAAGCGNARPASGGAGCGRREGGGGGRESPRPRRPGQAQAGGGGGPSTRPRSQAQSEASTQAQGPGPDPGLVPRHHVQFLKGVINQPENAGCKYAVEEWAKVCLHAQIVACSVVCARCKLHCGWQVSCATQHGKLHGLQFYYLLNISIASKFVFIHYFILYIAQYFTSVRLEAAPKSWHGWHLYPSTAAVTKLHPNQFLGEYGW